MAIELFFSPSGERVTTPTGGTGEINFTSGILVGDILINGELVYSVGDQLGKVTTKLYDQSGNWPDGTLVPNTSLAEMWRARQVDATGVLTDAKFFEELGYPGGGVSNNSELGFVFSDYAILDKIYVFGSGRWVFGGFTNGRAYYVSIDTGSTFFILFKGGIWILSDTLFGVNVIASNPSGGATSFPKIEGWVPGTGTAPEISYGSFWVDSTLGEFIERYWVDFKPHVSNDKALWLKWAEGCVLEEFVQYSLGYVVKNGQNNRYFTQGVCGAGVPLLLRYAVDANSVRAVDENGDYAVAEDGVRYG